MARGARLILSRVFDGRSYPLALGPAGQVKFAAQGAAVGTQDNARPPDHHPGFFLTVIAHLPETDAEFCAHGFFRAGEPFDKFRANGGWCLEATIVRRWNRVKRFSIADILGRWHLDLMQHYPSHQSVPSVIHERVFFVLWIAMSALAILADGIEVNDHPDRAREIFSHMGIALLWCVPFGVMGFILRWRRLKKHGKRQAFLSSVANVK